MTTKLINHLRSIMGRSDWEFHGPAIVKMVNEATINQSPRMIDSDPNANPHYPAVFVDGSLLHGFSVIGPFSSASEAARWAMEKTLPGILGVAAGTVMMLEPPRDFEVMIDDPEDYAQQQGECYGSS